VSTLISIDHPWVDSSRAPLYILNFPSSTSDEELLACCTARETFVERARYSIAWVVDLSAIRTVTARQRQIFAAHLGRVERHNLTYNRGSALIVPNPVLRGVVTAVFWVKAPRFPYCLFAHRHEGIRWAEGQLRA